MIILVRKHIVVILVGNEIKAYNLTGITCDHPGTKTTGRACDTKREARLAREACSASSRIAVQRKGQWSRAAYQWCPKNNADYEALQHRSDYNLHIIYFLQFCFAKIPKHLYNIYRAMLWDFSPSMCSSRTTSSSSREASRTCVAFALSCRGADASTLAMLMLTPQRLACAIETAVLNERAAGGSGSRSRRASLGRS